MKSQGIGCLADAQQGNPFGSSKTMFRQGAKRIVPAEILAYHLQTSDATLHAVMLKSEWKTMHMSVLQSIYFLPSCALASITLLLVERICYIERYIVNTALEVLIERHSIGLNQVLLTSKLEAIIPVDGKCPIAQALV